MSLLLTTTTTTGAIFVPPPQRTIDERQSADAVGNDILAACKKQLLDVNNPWVDEFDVARRRVRCGVRRRLGIAKDGHSQCAPSAQSPASWYRMRSRSWASRDAPSDVGRNIAALMTIDQRRPPRPPAPLPPPPPTPTLLPPLPAIATRCHWCQMPSSPCHRLALVHGAVERCRRHQTPPSLLPLKPDFIVHRRHLVLHGAILCHVGKICCLKLHQMGKLNDDENRSCHVKFVAF